MIPPTPYISGDRKFEIREATLAEIIPLRHRVLRVGMPVADAYFDRDELPTSRHAGVFDATGEPRCCATLHLASWEDGPAWQLRGMAADNGFQGLGLGTAVLAYLDRVVAADPRTPDGRPLRTFFCNARKAALNFYGRQGWQIVSEEFDIPTAGPHRKMVRRIEIAQM